MESEPISPSDRAAIGDLLAGYCHAMDASRADLCIGLFTDDAVLETAVGNAEGRDEILAWIEGRLALRDAAFQVGHYLLNPLITLTSEHEARVRSMLLYTRMAVDRDLSAELLSTGLYEDEVRRTAAGWRFSRRRWSLREPLSDAYFRTIGRSSR